MTLLVRDEEDILRQNIDFHLSQGIDFIIATDNLSVDSTKDILKEYEVQGKLLYFHEGQDNYNQHEWVTKMARIAFSDYGANWVINNDADEFWWPNKHTIKEVLSSLPPSINVIEANRSNFVYLGSDQGDEPFFSSMIYKESEPLNPLGDPLPPKVAHRGNEKVKVSQGNHRVSDIGKQNLVSNLIEILHFPIRTEKQFLNKIVKGGAAYMRNNELPEAIGYTWKELYNKYKTDGNLKEYINSIYYDSNRLKDGLITDKLVKDTRLRNYLNGLNKIKEHPDDCSEY